METPPPMPDASCSANLYRRLPAVHQLADVAASEAWAQGVAREALIAAARKAIDECRQAIRRGTHEKEEPYTWSQARLMERLYHWLSQGQRPPLPEVINATGILLHTGLGRAPLARQAIQAIEEASRGYTALELDLDSGVRGSRADAVRSHLAQLTGAARATVVNNNAAALLLVLNTLAKDREVIVSRGELIEIGGSFRLPEIMAASGARLVEVGTTNKTRLSDYVDAIGEQTALLLKVHHSNFHVSGFTESVAIHELAKLGRERNVPVAHDIGSGALFDLSAAGHASEPVVTRSIQAEADIVLFSGDKLMGGPQAGIIAGNTGLVQAMEKNPLARALRCDKLALAALWATLRVIRQSKSGFRDLPLWQLSNATPTELRARAERIAEKVRKSNPDTTIEVESTTSYLGGGAVPGHGQQSVALVIRRPGSSDEQLARLLRTGSQPVVGRMERGAVYLDLRAVFPHQDPLLTEALMAALGQEA